jgi:hypothetical protein
VSSYLPEHGPWLFFLRDHPSTALSSRCTTPSLNLPDVRSCATHQAKMKLIGWHGNKQAWRRGLIFASPITCEDLTGWKSQAHSGETKPSLFTVGARPRNGCACLLLSLPHFLFRLRSQNPSVRDASRSWLLRTCSRGLSSFVRPKRSERRSAVDRAFGRARQARSTWPWSERAQVGASVAQKDGSRAHGPPLRPGQHRVPESSP